MDPFTQRMLEKAEQRSRAHGISNASKFPLVETLSDVNASNALMPNQLNKNQQEQSRKQTQQPQQKTSVISASSIGGKIIERIPADATSKNPPNTVLHFSNVNKENVDLGIEINIMTNNDVEVQVEVEERDITDSEEDCADKSKLPKEAINQPLAKIRDSSRNRLQRLGALYSNTDDLSSPIHRTEAQFHAGSSDDAQLNVSPSKSKQRQGRLVALANSINQWEDDTQHHHISTIPPPKPDLPSRKLADTTKDCPRIMQSQTTATNLTREEVRQNDSSDHIGSSKTKQLNWDPKVINSLEAQGFQRRESTTMKLAYDYSNVKECNENQEQDVYKVQKEQTKLCADKSVVNKATKSLKNTTNEELDKKNLANVKPGLVSGRAAVFEHKAATANQQLQRSQKDPTELSLKERLQLFERNKGEALVPKAAFGMAPPISKILQDKKDEAKSIITQGQPAPPVSIKSTVGDSKVRDKVAALVANAKTISESKIKADIYKQRQEDMQILANRANQQKELFEKNMENETNSKTVTTGVPSELIKNKTAALLAASSVVRPSPPPPPPPMPKFAPNQLTAKRRSPGNTIDDDESKRAKKSNVPLLSSHNTESVQPKNHLYPALSDLESTDSESYIDNCCTTATVSAGDAAEDDNESYVESEEAEDSSVGICDGSLGREIMQVVKHNEHNSHQKQEQMYSRSTKEVRYADKDSYYYEPVDSSINSSEASVGVDDYLDAALDENDDGDDDYTQESEDEECNISYASGRSKGTTTSNSFSFRKTSSKTMQWETIPEENSEILTNATKNQADASASSNFKQPIKSELSINQEDDNMVTLVHTVSFYRRQQNSANSTPVRKICREQQVLRSTLMDVGGSAAARLNFDTPQKFNENELSISEPDDDRVQPEEDEIDNDDLVQEKIKKLLDEVCKQQQVIAQTSQALNLCASTIEFSGSVESVEGERHLLVATHRRQACLDEVQRLRVEKSLRPLGTPKEKGRLTVRDITLRLREDYMRKLAAGTISGHHLLCLLKYNEHVLATKTVQTFPGALSVQFNDVLHMNDVYADFRINLEIYGMTAHREVLAHEVKYHINMNKKSGVKTPKKKGAENVLVLPPRQSPAGPNVVRTPALVQYASAIFSLREIQRTEWSLSQALGVSPLAGVVKMRVNCELSVSIKHKGFLTMFEDVTGYGAWHRRWAYLNGTVLNYWKYPDDEKKKAPMGTIDLYTCISQHVTVAPRDICARLNTLLLECQRPAKETDRESLIIVPNGRTTVVRHLLSADTREEREEWCAYFNKTLTLIRAWGPPQ